MERAMPTYVILEKLQKIIRERYLNFRQLISRVMISLSAIQSNTRFALNTRFQQQID